MSSINWFTMCPSSILMLCCVLVLLATEGRGGTTDIQVIGTSSLKSREVDTRIQFELLEGEPPGTVLGTIPTKPGFTYRFNEAHDQFQLNGTTGLITTTTEIDREELPSDRFDLIILSSQPTYPIEVRVVIGDINDNSPVFPDPSLDVTFSESANVGTRVILDTASDLDAGINDVTTDYRIVSGNEDGKFRLVVTTNPSGETPFLHLETTGLLDREAKATYHLNISAKDGGSPPRFGYLRVNVTVLDVNDNPPIFDHSDYSVSVNESVLLGTSVLQVHATDNDIGDNGRITYYLSESETQFSVDQQTGVISTAADPLDCQQKCPTLDSRSCPKSCVFTVYARDHGSPRQDGRAYVTVNLLDANDHDPIIRFRFFPSTANYATVEENAQNGSVVAAVSVQDVDEGPNGETFLEIRGGNELNHFRLDPPIVRVNGALDRERVNLYNLTIAATDRGNPPRSSTSFLVIHVNDVNDHEPVFDKSDYSAVLSELVLTGTFVSSVTATDDDKGINSDIYYAIASGNDRRWFTIDVHSGLITTAKPLDREEQDFVELKISARDSGPNPRWAYTSLKIHILDENDEAPVFTQANLHVTLSENAPPGSLVVVVSAVDSDLGTNGSIIYSLDPEVDTLYPDVFSVDSAYGRIITRIQLDRETTPSYKLKVMAKDQGNPPLSSTATVQVDILDVDDNSPVFYPMLYFAWLDSDTEVGSTVARVSAYDKDAGKNAIIRYYQLSKTPGGYFTVDEETGEVKLTKTLDVQHQTFTYDVVIGARNPGGRESTKPSTVKVYIGKRNENQRNSLEFGSSTLNHVIIEEDNGIDESTSGRKVGKVSVTRGSNAKYAIIDGDSSQWFSIDEKTGEIITDRKLDREVQSEMFLKIVAYDASTFVTTNLNVSVTDVNDCSPQFVSPIRHVEVNEDWPVGKEITILHATDCDNGLNQEIRYFLSLNPHDLFTIHPKSGMLVLEHPLRSMAGSNYDLNVVAKDLGSLSLSSTIPITVIVKDVNDHTPLFDHSSYETSILESTAVNERFFLLKATDLDCGDNGLVSYHITAGNEDSKFGIFPNGYLYIKSPLDREKRDYYSLTVVAKDNGAGSRSSAVSLIIHVVDENDNAPEFTNSSFVFYIPENEPPDSYVGKLHAEDADKGRNAELMYSISASQSDFAVDPKTGFIKTLHSFDREYLVEVSGHDYIVMEAVVMDSGISRLRDEAKVTVYITDVNDNAPVFVRTPYKASVSEGAPQKMLVIRVTATDADDGLNGNVVYSITDGNGEGCFHIDSSSGQVTVAKSLDRERTPRYLLAVEARNTGDRTSHSASASITVDILDENDNTPQFSVFQQHVAVLESIPVGYQIFNFSATDLDTGINGDVSFSIAAGNVKETFKMDSTSGVLYLSQPLDFEEQDTYYLNITASDGGAPRLTSTIQFVVKVMDVNDNAPTFPNIALVRQIEEGVSVGTPVLTVIAEDRDSGSSGEVKYSISEQDPPGRHFAIKADTGVVYTVQEIDREFSDTFRVTIVATDQALPETTRLSAEKSVTVIVEDINDNTPTFVSMDCGVLPEGSSRGFVVMTVSAADPDANTNGMVSYEMVDGSGDLFLVDKNTGQIYLSRHVEKPEVTYTLTVRATDEAIGSNRKSSRSTVTIIGASNRQDGPAFSRAEYSGSVFENTPVGTSVLKVHAEPPQNGRQVRYFLTGIFSKKGVPQKRVFAVNLHSGVVSTAAELDREQGEQEYDLEIYAAIIEGLTPRTSKAKVTISLIDHNDSPPLFTKLSYKVSLSEDAPPGHTVTTVLATDPDTEGSPTYSILPNGDEKEFHLDSKSGVLVLRQPLDREQHPFHFLRIKVDDGVHSSESSITVEVTDTNDNPPIFKENIYSFDILEDAQRGAQVGMVSATDADLGINKQVSYSVLSDWGNDVFSLNPQTGVFTLTSRLDYEQVRHYVFVVQAQDSGQPSLSTTVTVYFNVLDLNDNAPLFDPMSYSDEVFENVTIGTSILQVTATDLDSGDSGRILYSILEGDDNKQFSISENGVICTAKALDREIQSFYSLVVSASDQAMPEGKRLSSTVLVTIILKDVNDMVPEFITPNQSSVMENVPINTVVMAVKAVDKDEGRNSYIEYSLVPQYDNKFTLGPVDGLLRLNGNLDREVNSQYEITVIAKDRGYPSKSVATTIVINILDENDNAPIFDPKRYSTSVSENASVGLSILQVTATDQDAGLNGQIRYSIIAGDPNYDFIIGEDTGIIHVAKKLDYERRNHYYLTAQAEDSGSNILYDTASITITITDVNDNPPKFLHSPFEIHVVENAKILPMSLVTITAEDADLLPNNQLHYMIKDGNRSLFQINSSTGEIILQKALDREQNSEYVLTVLAMDSGSPRQTGTGTVTVLVSDVNDNVPRFERTNYVGRIMENLPPNSQVITITAEDTDTGKNGLIKYSLLGDHLDKFSVDHQSGTIFTKIILDREKEDKYVMVLMAQDSGFTVQLSSTVTVTILLEDENDNYPQFSDDSYLVYIPDTAAGGHFVFGASAEDPDIGLNGRLVYHLSGTDADKFQINQDTGVVKLVQKLVNRSEGYHLEIHATDSSHNSLTSSASVELRIQPASFFPVFHPGKNTFIFPETAEHTLVTKVSAESFRIGSNGKLSYNFAGGNIGKAFTVNSQTGEVWIDVGLDHETVSKYELWIEARDNGIPPLASVVQLTVSVTDVNDNNPVFEKEIFNATVLEEESSKQLVTTIHATDLDSGKSGEITYHFSSSEESLSLFTLDSKSGKIFTKTSLDREEKEVYNLKVEAVDEGTPQRTGTATVRVVVLDKNDNPPRFTRLFSVNITENAPIGTFVIQVTSSDKDIGSNANATYSFAENPGSKFHIDPVSGNVTIVGWIDREVKDEYLLKVAAVDGSWRAETPLTISVQDINDNAPQFTSLTYHVSCPELQPPATVISEVLATDTDKHGPNSLVSYSLKQPSNYFRIDPVTGEIFTKQTLHYKRTMKGSSPINQHFLQAVATDHGQPPLSSEATVIITVTDSNNNSPVFDKSHYFSPVPYNAAIGLSVLQVLALDEKDVGVNAEIEYSKVLGNGSALFNIHKTTGWITVGNSLLEYRTQNFSFRVQATDKGVPPKSSEVTVQLVITGENHFSPMFTGLTKQVIIPENESLNSKILVITATDADPGLNGEVSFSITKGNTNESFFIDSTTGVITVAKALDFEILKEYNLYIMVADKGFRSRHTVSVLTVIITDVNDNPPLFNASTFDTYIAENEPPGTLIAHLIAKDIDSSRNAVIQYSVVGSNANELFTIDSQTGVLRSKIMFDYEEKNVYSFEIVASNPGSSLFSSTKVIVHILSRNEFNPHFIQPVFQFTVCESAKIGTVVGTLQATDEDTGPDGEIFFLFIGSSNDKGFHMHPTSGTITVSHKLDRESQARVVLTVMAKNSGSIHGNDTDEAQVVISIEDGNDPPAFLKEVYKTHISEGAPPSSSVVTLAAIDTDVRPNNNQFSYFITYGDPEKSFSIDPQTGVLSTTAVLDRESISSYNLTVAAIDNGSPPQTGTTLVHIIVDDVNDNGPIFDPPEVIGYVMENESAFTSIMVLSATDRDLAPNGAPFTYFLVGGDQKHLFEIDHHTGLVKTTQSLDREQASRYEIIVEVHDNGIPQMKSRHKITIIVTDQNDSPSSPRGLAVFVWIFGNVFPGGKIGDIHPLDPDVTENFQCTLVDGNTSVFSIKNGCDLHVGKLQNPLNYTLTVSGNDGKHSDVTSTIRVQFMSFDNKTIENSVTLHLLNSTAEYFLAQQFERFQKVLNDIFKHTGSPIIYSITPVNENLELTISVKKDEHYISTTDILSTLEQKKPLLKRIVRGVVLGYDPCQTYPCHNRGDCQSFLKMQDSLFIIDSPTLVFASPTVSRQFKCTCPQGFSGHHCQFQDDPCSPNPCLSGGTCHHTDMDYYCACIPQFEGKRCENTRKDSCTSNPCWNGGTCQEAPNGSFFCICRPGFRGTVCEQTTDNCRPNRCLNGGTCISEKPGYHCLCEVNFFGRHCENSAYGFHPYSFMTFPPLDSSTNDISIIFATNKQNALLVYNYGLQTGGRSDFIALEIVEGYPQFSYGGVRTAIATVRASRFVADDKWHKITVIRNGKVTSLSAVDCSEKGEMCEECFHGNTSCSRSVTGHAGTLNFNSNLLYLGGVSSVEPLLERPGQVSSDDFIGCIHSVSVNGRILDLGAPLQSVYTSSTCNRKSRACDDPGLCGTDGTCYDLWFSTACNCVSSAVTASNCNEALEPFSFGQGGAFLELLPQEKHRRMLLLMSSYHTAGRWKRAIKKTSTKTLSFTFKTRMQDCLLLHAVSDEQNSILQLKGGHLQYLSGMANGVHIVESLMSPNLADGQWHTLTVEIGQETHFTVNITVDSYQKEISRNKQHDVLDPYLSALTIGGSMKHPTHPDVSVTEFQGCMKMILVNGEVQAVNSTNSYFKVIPHGTVLKGCCDEVLGLDISTTDPLSIGVILVIAFFVILIVVILISFLMFRRCKLKREKSPGHVKPKGNAFLASMAGNCQRSRYETNYTENISSDDIIRSHKNQDLIIKKFKEKEGISDRPQRPDIIEREVLNKSPAVPAPRIDEHHMQESSKAHPSFGVTHLPDTEPPEHYDLENASSIAPSDIDVVYHYKGFRNGNVHRYKSNSHALNFHKHNHRHSPHQFQTNPAQQTSHNILCQNSSHAAPRESPSALKMQNTPLARLSPSSELSQQTPRILTLQDISGKPLQTALLATSQGVGAKEFKDPMTNSERSLNSPVSNLSQSTSSIHSRAQTTKKKGAESTLTVGLTAEEIDRLNARPRNSSLVSTLDAVSSSSDNNPEKNKLAELLETNTELLEVPDSSTDESGNDSFTCSEFEYDNNYDKGHHEFGPGNMIFSKLAEEDNENDEDSAKTYTGFDSFRGSLSTLVASDDDLSNLSSYKPINGSMLGWDYLLNWGPNFQNLVGVFKDIAELPDAVNLPLDGHSKPNEEYV